MTRPACPHNKTIPCEPCVDRSCPDCESPWCPGYGCIGRVRMETFPFATVRVCRVPKGRREPLTVVAEGSKPCRSCGKPFVPKWSHHRACSDECRKDVRRLKRVLECDWCGEEFVQRAPLQKRCGPECMAEHRREFERLRSERRRQAVSR